MDKEVIKLAELAQRIYEQADPWDREYEPDEIVKWIVKDPRAVIEYLLNVIDDLQA